GGESFALTHAAWKPAIAARSSLTDGDKRATGASTGEGLSEKSFLTKSVPCKGENGDLFGPIGSALKWVEINDITWKLTDGTPSRTPTSHGQWAGYNTEAALAWVMEVGWPFKKKIDCWYARCGNKTHGPTDLHTAKQAALALANGATSFPEHGIAMAFDGTVNLHADPEVDAEKRKLARKRKSALFATLLSATVAG